MLVLLEPDVAEAFSDGKTVNQALRASAPGPQQVEGDVSHGSLLNACRYAAATRKFVKRCSVFEINVAEAAEVPSASMNRREFLALALTQIPFGAPGVRIFERPRDYSGDLRAWLRRLLSERNAGRRRLIASIDTREKVLERQKYVRAKLWELLGGKLEKTPLNPRTTGSIRREGYRIDKLIFESRPGLYVTSNLYVPDGSGPFPAVLSPLGHSATGKSYGPYQTLFHSLARKGYIVLAYDPFGQGERIEYPGERFGDSALGGATREHHYAGKRLLLLGVNFGLYRTWDGIRGVDYLLSRDDVDPKRIGCGGQSGGGTLTMFLAALDERIQAAVVSEGNTENMAQDGVEPPGSVDDAEQNIVPALVHGFDRFDLLHAFAPRPLAILVANKDAGTTYSPKYISDSLALLEELKVTYRLFGAEDRLTFIETPMRHGYHYELRRASYGFYNRWLGRRQEDDSEPPVTLERDAELWCTESGFVVKSLKGETSFTLTRALAAMTRPARPATAEDIRRILALPAESAEPRPRTLSITEKLAWTIEELDIASEREIHVPAWVVRPKQQTGRLPTVLLLSDAAKDTFIDGDLAADFTRAGIQFCCADLRGRHQAMPHPPPLAPRYFDGRGEDSYVFGTLVANRPMLGGYVWDSLQLLRALRARPDVDPSRLWMIGSGTMGVVALLALATDSGVRGGIVRSALASWRWIVENDEYSTPFRIFLFGVLQHFDLPDVAALVAPRPLLVLNPADQAGRDADASKVRALYKSAMVRTGVTVTPATYLDWMRQA